MLKRLILLSLLSTTLLGCDSNDDVKELDSVLIKKNEYFSTQFNVDGKQQVNVKVSLLNNVPSEAFIITEEEYKNWEDETQTNDFASATLISIVKFSPVPDNLTESGWIKLESGDYRILIENTDFGSVSPQSVDGGSISVTNSTNVMYSILYK
ncbi:hypothetical protein L4D21_21610 [Photobacterium profundum]|uniref:hypothetical protein n=1 Tax=Photobacterium profundum TaxID=74109 RepID=UPI003D0AB591